MAVLLETSTFAEEAVETGEALMDSGATKSTGHGRMVWHA